MPRTPRVAPGGWVYHVLNRAVARLPLFRKEADYAAFERVMLEAYERHPTRILAWCLMRNHWHFVLWPREDGELTAFVRWLSHTHVMRWHVARADGRPDAHADLTKMAEYRYDHQGRAGPLTRRTASPFLSTRCSRRVKGWSSSSTRRPTA